ncbi:MAG: TatD family hydrolase [Alphaproteobacteria bacterium]|nr:TatD family hydrolase [Alphaproteobacteria bacterium]
MIIDSHCHLDFKELSSDLDSVIKRASESGVEVLQTICTKISEFDKIRSISEKYNNVYCSVGVHPHEVKNEGVIDCSTIIDLASHPKVIGIGETGLDYYYEHSDKDDQIKSFRNHIEASRITKLPIIIHTRSAEEDTISILREEMQKGVFPALIHCFTSTQELANECLDMGMYISISGIITFKNAEELRSVIKTVPLERMLVETDAPYLAPVPMRGKSNEPAFVKYTVEYLANLINQESIDVENVTTKNFLDLFSKAKL